MTRTAGCTGRKILDAVKGVASNAIKGQMSAREALHQMLAGTPLTVVQDRANGALSLARADDPNGRRAAQATAGSPRPNRTTSPSENAREDTIELSPFSVSADRDMGYIAGGSLAGSRLNTDLKDTAASLSILTKEFMDDIGATSIADVLASSSWSA